jgi:hypothetical protein
VALLMFSDKLPTIPSVREWRFSVADLLAMTTLIAIVLGFAIYLLRK